MPRGGKRDGAGRPKGSLEASTLRKQAIRQRWLKRFEADADRVYDSLVTLALGHKFLVARDSKSGKFIPLDDERTQLMIKCGQAETLEMWDRPPNVQAATFLSDRAIDKPSEHVQVSGEGGGPVELTITSRLALARKRLATTAS